MPRFSDSSRGKLSHCRSEIQAVLDGVIRHYDFTVVTGYRDDEQQDFAYETGMSKVKWPNSKHNQYPSEAVDIAPYPIDWRDTERFYLLAGRVLQVADELGVRLRWGGDWDGDDDLHDQTFMDLGHFELVSEPEEDEVSDDGFSITYV